LANPLFELTAPLARPLFFSNICCQLQSLLSLFRAGGKWGGGVDGGAGAGKTLLLEKVELGQSGTKLNWHQPG